MASIVDKPKISGDKDLLEIEKYTNGLIKFIENSATPITIGVQGEWGSGKTSLLNTIRQELCDRDGAEHYAVWLNTWEYSLLSEPDETLIRIIIGLIDQVGNLTKKNSADSFKKVSAIGKSLLSRASRSGGVFGMAAGVANDVVEMGGVNQENTISQLRESLQDVINQVIDSSGKRAFIFFIDDLDRLDPSVAVSILELIKNLFDLEHCVFVLAIDYSVVVKGLQSKFGKMTEQNEWEFRAFFDKIIQLPFSMPVSSYNISMYLKSLLVNVNYFEKNDLDDEKVLNSLTEIVGLSVGTNPRALKRLANSVSLIEIIRGEQEITPDERVIEFALICIQIAYPTIYGLIQKEADFTKWSEQFIYSVLKNKKIDEKDLEALKESEEFDEEWEQNLWRVCQVNNFLKERSFLLSRLLNFIKDNIPNIKHELMNETLERLLSMSSVTSVSSEVTVVRKNKKTNFGKPIKEFIKDVYRKMSETKEYSRTELRKLIFTEIKNGSGMEIQSNTLSAQLTMTIINDTTRQHYGVNKDNMNKVNLFYYVDENNKKGSIKKYLPDNPPKGYKIYYRDKDTKEDMEVII